MACPPCEMSCLAAELGGGVVALSATVTRDGDKGPLGVMAAGEDGT